MAEIVYLLWSNKHRAWWRSQQWGYTEDIDDAGRYSEAEAVKCVIRSAQCGIRDQVTCMVAAPDNWSKENAAAILRTYGGTDG